MSEVYMEKSMDEGCCHRNACEQRGYCMINRIEELIAERDEAWKRADHAEKMWGEAEVKLAKASARIEELEAIRMMNEWLDEIEVFSLRRERLYEDFPEVKDKEKLLKWLEAAYNVGYEDGRNH